MFVQVKRRNKLQNLVTTDIYDGKRVCWRGCDEDLTVATWHNLDKNKQELKLVIVSEGEPLALIGMACGDRDDK